ncbi:peptidase [Streptomyces halstedii]|uniref:peptidase n=1 Tax=Streptomyces halstedii TaxID=1944 RepID=UPI0037FDB287
MTRMSPRTAPLRTTGALGVTGLLAAGSLAVGAPAHAADPVFTLGGPAETAVRPYPVTGPPRASSLEITVHHPDTGQEGSGYEGEVTYTLDLGGIEGVAVLSPAEDTGADCRIDGATAVCHTHGVRPGLGGVAGFALTAAEGGADGATGTIEVTGSADGAVFVPFTTRVTVGGPDLVMKRLPFERRLRPGDVQPAPITFSNRGTRAADGVLLTLRYSRGLEIPERYGNCVYDAEAGEEPFDAFAWSTALCSVEGSFEPGATYTLGVPLSVRAGPHAYADTFVYGVTEDAPARTARRAGAALHRGTGPELTLSKVTAVATRGADLDPSDNQREADFRTENTADFIAVGGTGTGAAGERVTARIGYRNDGPAWIGHLRSGESVATLDFTVPEGAEVTAKPPSCRGVTAGGGPREDQLGAPRYVCDSSTTVRDGAEATLPFELKITEAVPGAVGTVRIRGPLLSAPELPFDPEPAGNTALWVLNGDGGPGTGDTGGTKGSTGGGASGTNGSDGSGGGSTGRGAGGDTAGSASGTTGGASSSVTAGSVTAGTSGPGPSGTGGALASTGTVVLTLFGGAAAALAAGGVLYVTARRRASHR